MTRSDETAYIELIDTGDLASLQSPGFPYMLKKLVAEAYLIRGGISIDSWFRSGYAQKLILKETGWETDKSPWFQKMPNRFKSSRAAVLSRMKKEGDIYREGFFTPAEVDLYGYLLVSLLESRTNEKQLDSALGSMRGGLDLNETLSTVGKVDLKRLEADFFATLRK
ncbi:MAG: hypothetical protein R3C11_28920 [Planctomycetaceae bacterium]